MALVRCEDCEKAISSEAYTCPHCGRPRRSPMTKFLVIGAIAVAGLVFAQARYGDSQREASAGEATKQAADADKKRAATPPPPQKTAQKAPAKAKGDPLQRASTGAKILKKALPNADGARLESALVVEGTGVVCYEYLALNHFGGMTSGKAVLSSEGKMVNSSSMGFSQLWTQECENKKGAQVGAQIDWTAM